MNDGASSHAQTQAKRCQRWSGPPEWYQAEARTRLGVTLHVWIAPTCGTPMCLRVDHLDEHAPSRLDYPDGICVYCGFRADTVDHLLPRTWTGAAARRYVLTVPACHQCNAIIQDSYAPAINERREIVHEALYRKYCRKLGVAEDIDEVLSELGPNLRSAVEAQIELGDAIRDRLAWPGTTGYDLGACIRSGIEDPYAIGLLTATEPVDYVGSAYQPAHRRTELAEAVPRQRSRAKSELINPATRAMPIDGPWIPAPRRPWQGMLDLWRNGRGKPGPPTCLRCKASLWVSQPGAPPHPSFLCPRCRPKGHPKSTGRR